MFLFFLLVTAIKRRDESLIKILLKLIDSSLLIRFGHDEESIVNEFARKGLVDAIKELKKINPLLITHHSKKGKTALTEAVFYNKLPVINYLTGAQLFKFASSLHQEAYFGRVKPTEVLALQKTTAKDSANRTPLVYAVAGGKIETIAILLAATPVEEIDINELVVNVIVNNHSTAILSMLLAKKPLACTPQTIQQLLKALEEHDESLAMFKKLLALMSDGLRPELAESLIIEAVKGNYQLEIEKMIPCYQPGDSKMQAALLKNLTNVLIAKNREEAESSQLLEMTNRVFNGFTDFLTAHPAEIFKIAVVLIVSDAREMQVNNLHLLRRLLSSVPKEVAIEVVSNEAKKYPSKLAELAQQHKKMLMYGLLLPFDNASDDKGVKVFFQHISVFHEIIKITQQTKVVEVGRIKDILTKIIAMHAMAVKSGSKSQGFGNMISSEINQCLDELWKTVPYFCKSREDKESLEQILDLILFILEQKKLPLNAYHFSRVSHLAFALGRAEEAEKKYQMIAKISCTIKENKNPRIFAHLSLTKVLLDLTAILKVKVRPDLQALILLNWPKLCYEIFVADGALLQAEPTKLDSESFLQAESALPSSLPLPESFDIIPPDLLEEAVHLRYALLIKCNVLMFKNWLSTFERKIAKSIPHEMEKLESFQLTSGLRPQAENLLAFLSFKEKLLKYLLSLMDIIKTCMQAEHLSYELPASFQTELSEASKMVAHLKKGLKALPLNEKTKKKIEAAKEGKKSEDKKPEERQQIIDKTDLSSEELSEELPADPEVDLDGFSLEQKEMMLADFGEEEKVESTLLASVSASVSSPFLFKPNEQARAKPVRKRFLPSAEVPLADFLVSKEKPRSSPASKDLPAEVSERFKIKDENFKVPAPLRHFFEAIGPDKLVLAGSAVPYLVDHKNKQPGDYDVVTAYTKEELYAKVKKIGGAISEQGMGKIKSYCVTFENFEFDVTIARGLPHQPFRERLREDAKARIIPICSLFYDPFAKKEERIIDYVNGLDDLKNNHVTVGDPTKLESLLAAEFKQMLRIVRLAGHGRSVDPDIVAAIKKNKELLHSIPSKTLKSEIEKFFIDFNYDVEKINTLFKEYEFSQMQLIPNIVGQVINEFHDEKKKKIVKEQAMMLGMLRK